MSKAKGMSKVKPLLFIARWASEKMIATFGERGYRSEYIGRDSFVYARDAAHAAKLVKQLDGAATGIKIEATE